MEIDTNHSITSTIFKLIWLIKWMKTFEDLNPHKHDEFCTTRSIIRLLESLCHPKIVVPIQLKQYLLILLLNVQNNSIRLDISLIIIDCN